MPQEPGKLRLRFHILAAELAAPQESEHLLETSGEVIQMDADAIDEWRDKELLSHYRAENDQA